jgi:hypothetical protein
MISQSHIQSASQKYVGWGNVTCWHTSVTGQYFLFQSSQFYSLYTELGASSTPESACRTPVLWYRPALLMIQLESWHLSDLLTFTYNFFL